VPTLPPPSPGPGMFDNGSDNSTRPSGAVLRTLEGTTTAGSSPRAGTARVKPDEPDSCAVVASMQKEDLLAAKAAAWTPT
jgi:hypothetical protein